MGVISDNWKAMDGISTYDKHANTITAYTPHAVTQVIGYIKFVLKDELVVFRGQRSDYKSIIPSLYRQFYPKNKIINDKTKRNIFSERICNRKVKELEIIISYLKNNLSFVQNTDDKYLEAIIQHYGFKTRYVDFVDNIWVALSFSVIASKSSAFRFSDDILYFDDKGYGYIYILSLGKIIDDYENIYTTSKDYEVIDLRKSLPSMYLRPHSQHGLLVRKKPRKSNRLITTKSDMIDDVVTTIKINKSTALKWINYSRILSPDFLFPSVNFDYGYASLATVHTKQIFDNLITDKAVNYRSPIDLYFHFGCVKLYTFEQGKSDYSE
jgi:hypothetical protein